MKQSDPQPTLVLIHDLLGSTSEFDFIAPILAAREVRIDGLSIDGYSHGAGRPALAWRRWVDAAERALDARHAADAPVLLAGVGTGAALAAMLALRPRRQHVAGVALLACAFDRCGRLSPRHRAATRFGLDRWAAVACEEPFGVKNPKTRKQVARQLADDGRAAFGPAALPLRAMRESDRLFAHVCASLASLPSLPPFGAPLLALHAREDADAPLDAVERLVATINERGRHARLIALEHSYHRITIDNDRQRVAHELADFLGAPKRRAAPSPTSPDRVAVAAG